LRLALVVVLVVVLVLVAMYRFQPRRPASHAKKTVDATVIS
tara:strand:+ start:595 stop:717 length:123 start_codon:yes stop_codon:yes gene_type:complete